AVARDRKTTPVDLFIQIVKDGGAGIVCTSMVDEDIRAFYQRPWVMVGSDGGINARHPRGAGTFPKVLGRYVREQHWITLPDAIRKMTRAPAERLHLKDRGRLEVGAIADLVVFNANTVIDRSTFSDPMALATGIEKVFVGGELVWNEGKPAGGRARGEPAVRAHVDLSRQGVAEAKPLVDGLVTVRLTLETTFLFLFEWSTASAFPDSAHPAARRPARSSPRGTRTRRSARRSSP